jgi:hypothetical protein
MHRRQEKFSPTVPGDEKELFLWLEQPTRARKTWYLREGHPAHLDAYFDEWLAFYSQPLEDTTIYDKDGNAIQS